ncbi:MAG: ribosomal protein S18-alanine N-acetyltransferase [Gammaproteobacteria bacterium]|nr:ribosomal protein S18-alanine N-acetyltransferase [Gammaproteobacteria bacterium]NNF60270.1 ribosomal protein S18-alanine N-acetyltransferase [Gammaproteobacteria bacterium]NNM20378.1 ribosomal protein S18-alanine N-acetyltransferase [Gammaproteobacteria bacterium]
MSAAPQAVAINIRPMRPADIMEVHRIEARSYPFPWSIGIFRDCLQAGYLCRVLDTADGLAGYSVVSVAAGEAHILNLCIRQRCRRQQLGNRFLQHVIDEVRQLGVMRAILEVRPSNEAAIGLYQSAGFTRIGSRRDYYPAVTGREDALVLARELGPATG